MAFTLRVTQGDDESEDLSFESGEVRMGRTADNDVVIKDPSSSRNHARVYEEDGRFFVEDLKSANGTTLNARPLKAPAELKTGDRIAIGDVVLEFAATAPKDLLRPSRVVPVTSPQEEAPAPTAAERARERRELQRSSTGRVQLLWNEFPRPTRIVVGIVGVIATVAMLGALVSAALPRRLVKRSEPTELVPNGEPIAESFGAGDGVTFSRPDMKSFTFSFAAPTGIVGVLHYQARDCGKDEVSIELNGTQVGTVPPDTVEVDQRQLEIVLPSAQLRVNQPNEVVFDNVSNPPAGDPWRLWNVWVEVIPVPQMSADEVGRRAKANFERAARLFDLREVGAMNLFRAWKEYRDAWLLLEATPDSPPEMLQIARGRMREIRPMLDQKCATMLVIYQREVHKKQPDREAARKLLQEIPAHFEKEHHCLGLSRALLGDLEDLGVLE